MTAGEPLRERENSVRPAHTPSTPERLQLAGFVLDLSHRELLTPDHKVADLRKQALEVLLLLGARAGHVVTKDELMRSVWAQVVVGEDSLVQAIAEIRRVLGDREHQLVRTVARRGYMLVPQAPAGDTPANDTSAASARKRNAGVSIALVATLVLVVAIGAGLLTRSPGKSARSDSVPSRSLVVLPLGNQGGAEESWFADAVTADLTSELGGWHNVLVIGRDTARVYAGKAIDPRDVARELGVRYVIRGSVRRNGDRVRLDLAMVDGESGGQRWAEQIDVERARLAQSLDDIKGGVAKTLVIELGRSIGERAAKMRPEQVEADDIAMQGFAVFLRSATQENFLEARRLFEQAVARDPDSFRGLAGVSLTNSFGASMQWMPEREASVKRAEETLARLQSLGPHRELTLMARASLANLHADWEAQLAVSAMLLEHYPSGPTSHHHRCSALLRLGGFEEAIPSCLRAIKISPRDSRVPIWQGLAGMNHFMLGQYTHAADYTRRTVTANPKLLGYWPVLAASLALDGRRDEGRQVLKEFMERNPTFESARIPPMWRGDHPRFAAGRDKIVATVRELGLP